MKILLFYSSHRQLEEYKLSSEFFNKSKFLKEKTDVMVYCDNDSISFDTLSDYVRYETKVTVIKGKQIFQSGIPTGISGNGIHIGLSNMFDKFQDYDYVINMVPDCYITDDTMIFKLLQEEFETDTEFIVDYHPNHSASCLRQYCCDFFVFKPKKIKNIFSEVDMDNLIAPENFIYQKISENSFKVRTINRVGSLSWDIDNYGLIHNHNLNRIRKILYEGINDQNLRHF